jgi:chromosome segregation ATPase
MPRLEKELDDLRLELDREREARVAAEQSSAVAAAKLEGAQEARTAADEALEQANSELANLRQELRDSRAANGTLQADLLAKADLLATARPRIRRPLKSQGAQKKS